MSRLSIGKGCHCEMEDKLRMEGDQPVLVDSFEPLKMGGREWKLELNRAVVDVGRIAQSRLKSDW
jgi:hypothetical protein